ncbi:MAG: radical SAM protein [Candidatus Diapherotrites archaeon]|nr:radical SAM protein [Candidatus Diapherotrites archaeon]
MKVALVRPSYHTHIVSPPLGMGYVASALNHAGHEARIIDGLNQDLNDGRIIEKVQEFGAQLAGIYCMSAYFLRAVELTQKLHAAGIRVMMGGTQPTFLPEFTMQKSGVDFIVSGEAEETVVELASALEKGIEVEGIPGVYTGPGKKFFPRDKVVDLDKIPFPDWEQIDPRTYKKAPHGGLIRHFPYAPITSTRGCPYRCTFCASPKFSQKQITFRSPENVVAEIELLADKYGVKEIHFEDDNFTLKRSHAEGVCRLLIEKNIKVVWACPNGVRADKVDLELLRLMKKAGCYYLAFGIESGNQKILDTVIKDTTLEKIETAVRLADQVGIMTQGFFIFGLPGETEQTIEQTIEFAKRIPLTRAQFLVLDVMPGTALWDELRFDEKVDWTKNSYHEITWTPPTVKRESLEQAAPRAFKAFYFRPRQAWSILKYMRPEQIPFIIQRVLDYGLLKLPGKKTGTALPAQALNDSP